MIPTHYKDRRSEGDTVLRQCQLVQLHLLYVLDAICKEYGLTYFLSGGTALGAERHNGFIPWDDDLDVGMPMRDYKKFIKIARKSLPEDVTLQTPKDVPFSAIPFSKIRDGSSYYAEIRPDVSTADPSGIFLDIFPYEEMPEFGYPLQRFIVQAVSSSWMRRIWFYNKAREGLWQAWLFSAVGVILGLTHAFIRGFVWIAQRLLPCRSVFLLFEAGYVHRYKKDWIYPLSNHKFEDGQFPVPGKADEYLASQYGDWRQVPPPEKRPRHATIIDPFHSAI